MIIKDIWLTLTKIFGTVIVVSLFSMIMFLPINVLSSLLFQSTINFIIYMLIIEIVFLKFYINVFKAYNQGYVINNENKTFSFPASDVENSISDIILLKPFFNLSKRTTINISDLVSLNNETKNASKNGKTIKQWFLNISGHFGSQQLEFNSKQKRDECRSALAFMMKQKSSDMNLDI